MVFTIGRRVTVGFAIVTALAALLGGYAAWNVKAVDEEIVVVVEECVPAVAASEHARYVAAENFAVVLRHITTTEPTEKQRLRQQLDANAADLTATLTKYEKTITRPEDRAAYEKLAEQRASWLEALNRVLPLSDRNETAEAMALLQGPGTTAYLAMRETAAQLSESSQERTEAIGHHLEEAAHSTLLGIYTLSGAVLGLAVFAATLIIRSTNRALTRMSSTLGDGSAQVAAASTQVSGSAQSLAQGASEQAAALEETTSALEEMASMTRRNAEAAGQASTLAAQARAAAEKGNTAMERMTGAIDSIQRSAQDTAKILKAIDEIAFQTNLLALNAAVEAARAGEAGKGFAVVAEEVRNLAMRSAEAAKNTAGLIDESVQSSRNGVTISMEVGATLAEITGAVGSVNDLIAEIAQSSQEQTRGIDQINQAVAQMDQVTQSSAANAEQSAAAAEELSSQATQLRSVVGDLQTLVQGERTSEHAAGRAAPSRAFDIPPARGSIDAAFSEFRSAA